MIGVGERFPASLRGYEADHGRNIFRKIFTAPDFVSYFGKQSEQPGYFEKNRQHISSEPRKLVPPAPLPDFADPQMQNASVKLRELYQRYQHAADLAEQKQLQSAYFKLTMDFTAFSGRRLSSQPAKENVKYSDFVKLVGKALGWSARVEN